VSRKKRAAMLEFVRQHYESARDLGTCLELKAPNDDTKYVWIFMLSKTFNNIE